MVSALQKNSDLSLRAATRKKGFTLTEIAIVLGIIGLILGAIWTAASGVYNNQRVSHANTAVLQIVQGIRSLYASTGSTAGLTEATLINAAAVPGDLINSSTTPATLNSPFPGGSTDVSPTGDGLGFEVTMSGLSQANCISLLTAIAGTNRDPGLTLAEAGGGPVGAPSTVGSPLTSPITPSLAAASPANSMGGCTGSSTYVADFVFSLR